jgi:hypothetical protein
MNMGKLEHDTIREFEIEPRSELELLLEIKETNA